MKLVNEISKRNKQKKKQKKEIKEIDKKKKKRQNNLTWVQISKKVTKYLKKSMSLAKKLVK